MPPFEHRLVRREHWRMPRLRRLGGQRDLQGAGNRLGDVVLDGEDVGQLAVVAFRPQVITVLRVDELCGDADASARPADTPFEDGADAERFGDRRDVLFLAAERER